ncbi:hypothetical protein [Stomatobaculum longum]|uniref:hypothetical protein n=1 Tax=Stomatobaculum longum TaxID=796942 RepID=UPI0028E5E7D2|nr:hypothetical protein [Stomatobaculum longum]
MRILIAEDERSLNEIIAKKLTSDGYSVDCCYEDDDGRGVYEIDAHSGAILEASAKND